MRGMIIGFSTLAIAALPTMAIADGNGAITGAAGGAVAGAVVGGPVGAAVGGVAGGVIGGAASGPGPGTVVVAPAQSPWVLAAPEALRDLTMPATALPVRRQIAQIKGSTDNPEFVAEPCAAENVVYRP